VKLFASAVRFVQALEARIKGQVAGPANGFEAEDEVPYCVDGPPGSAT